jgi:hypothetical protein
MYSEITEWKTGPCNCECESNFLSWVVPCHVYAKLSKAYTSNLLLYLCLWFNIQFMYCYVRYVYVYKCPPKSSDQCIGLSEDCETYYITIDGSTASCMYIDNMCVHKSITCIDSTTVDANIGVGLFFIGILDIILYYMHYQLRKRIQEKYQLRNDNDCLATTCCSSCGLAQEYRETI